MQRLLESDLDVVVNGGFVFAPLLLDPSIDAEVRAAQATGPLIEVDGKRFVRTLSLRSLIENYAYLHPNAFAALRTACLEKWGCTLEPEATVIDDELRTVLFQIMPYFVRHREGPVVSHRKADTPLRSTGIARSRRQRAEADASARAEEVLELLCRRIEIPEKYLAEATRRLDPAPLHRALHTLEAVERPLPPLEEGRIPARRLREWVCQALEVKILRDEKARLARELQERERSAEGDARHLAALLYIAETGALELDGFGFFRIGRRDEYVVYKRTGEYALRDYYGRVYLFPDCRVAVSTVVPLRPFVLERYKHPFLEGYAEGQPICMRGFLPPRTFNAANVIRVIEEGIHALLYGYSPRRRNGYHSLDRTLKRVSEPDSDAYQDEFITLAGRMRVIHFDDLRVPPDHPKLASGEVAITNAHTP